MTRSPDNIRIENRQHEHKIVWTTEPWRFLRLLFLLHPHNRGGCIWCGNIANVVEHGDYDYRRSDYLEFFRVGCVPMCSQCSKAYFRGKKLCPRCRQQGHYVTQEDQVCYSCTPAATKEQWAHNKERRRKSINERNRVTYRKYHPKKAVVSGKWVTLKTQQ